jgi:hypothetical protein
MGIGVWWKNGSWRVVGCGLKVKLEQPDNPVGIVRALSDRENNYRGF